MKRGKVKFDPFRRALLITCALMALTGCDDAEVSSPEPGTGTGAQVRDSSAAPDVLPSILKVKRQEKTYVITGIGLKGSTKVAIINNKVLIPGNEIDEGVVLEEIQSTYAIIRVGNTTHLLRPEDIQRELDKKRG